MQRYSEAVLTEFFNRHAHSIEWTPGKTGYVWFGYNVLARNMLASKKGYIVPKTDTYEDFLNEALELLFTENPHYLKYPSVIGPNYRAASILLNDDSPTLWFQ